MRHCAALESFPNVYLMRYIRFAESRTGKVFYFNRGDRYTLGVGVAFVSRVASNNDPPSLDFSSYRF